MMRYFAFCFCMLFVGSSALAQSDVQVYGSLDAGIYSKQLAGTGRTLNLNSIGITTPHWGIRGSEDLGGGQSAVFELSSFVRLDTGEPTRGVPNEPFWSRFAYVGLRGQWGMIRAGRLSDPGFVSAANFGPYGGSSAFGPFLMHTYVGGQPMLTGMAASDSAWSDSIAYSSPSFRGWTSQLAVTLRGNHAAGRRSAMHLRYDSGPFAGSLVYTRVTDAQLLNPRTVSDPAGAPYVINDVWAKQVAATYDFESFKIFGQHMRNHLKVYSIADIRLDTSQVGVSIPQGSGKWLVSWGRTYRKQVQIQEKRRDTVTVGYDYNLSKRTDLYAVILSDRVTGLSSGIGHSIGMRHNF